MINKLICLVTILFAVTGNISSQNLEEWQVYPSFSTVNSMSVSDEMVYVSTLGGIFTVQNEEIQSIITTMDGLYSANPTAVVFDPVNSRLWAGYTDGTLDVITIENNDIERLNDISRVSRFNSKRINDLYIYEGRLYVSTSFGIVVYNLDSQLVENSYLKFGEFNIGTEVNALDIVNDTLYAATMGGVVYGNLEDNLAESSKWETFNESDGLPSPIIDELSFFNSKLYTLINGQIFEYENTEWSLSTEFPDSGYTALNTAENHSQLVIATSSAVHVSDKEGNKSTYNPELESRINTVVADDQKILIGTSNEGIFILDSNPTQQQYLPTGPYLNFFSKIIVDNNAILATSTAEFPQFDPLNTLRGYYIFKDNTWESYNINTNSTLASERVGTVYSIGQNDSSYFFGSWGKGVVEHSKSTNDITVHNNENSNLVGLSSSPHFVVISALDNDSDNNMWAVSYDSEYPLNVKLNNASDWITFRGDTGSDLYFKLFIDSHDQKWISLITSSNSGKGLYILDTAQPEDPEDDEGIKLTSAVNNGNLPDDKVNAIVEDDNGEVWIGTGRGIARFIFPELIISGGENERRAQWLINEDTTATSRFLLRDVNVTALAVNNANQKWVGSENQGIWLLNSEGSKIEKRYTISNSDLISDNIESITINKETGEVFIATDLGLMSFQDIPKAPVAEMNKLKVFPNPFEYSRHNQVVIEGLSDETNIKIVGVDGVVVNELTARGGRISWNGYDYNGNTLGSGVYFIVAYEDSGREKGMGKVVIIR